MLAGGDSIHNGVRLAPPSPPHQELRGWPVRVCMPCFPDMHPFRMLHWALSRYLHLCCMCHAFASSWVGVAAGSSAPVTHVFTDSLL